MSRWFCSSGLGPGPVEPGRRVERVERVGRDQQQGEEERADHQHGQQRPAHQRVVEAARGTCAPPAPCSRTAPAPTAGSSPRAPPTGWRRCRAPGAVRAVVGHVLDGEVAGDQRPLHGGARPPRAPPGTAGRRTARAPAGAGGAGPGHGQGDDPAERRGQAEHHARRAQGVVHLCGPPPPGSPPSSASETRSS